MSVWLPSIRELTSESQLLILNLPFCATIDEPASSTHISISVDLPIKPSEKLPFHHQYYGSYTKASDGLEKRLVYPTSHHQICRKQISISQ